MAWLTVASSWKLDRGKGLLEGRAATVIGVYLPLHQPPLAATIRATTATSRQKHSFTCDEEPSSSGHWRTPKGKAFSADFDCPSRLLSLGQQLLEVALG
jgi:hypothetical protein